MKIDTATFRLERVNEAVGYLQTEIDDLEAIGFGDDTRLDDVPDAEEYRAPKPKKNKTARRRRKRRGDRDEDDDGRDRDDGSDNDDSNVNDNNNNDGENGDNANSAGADKEDVAGSGAATGATAMNDSCHTRCSRICERNSR